ncbi:MAG TPA: VWA domain-containing protein [Thermoanaerobaculia bacterium]|nr:VWA domain-containing protein [Thermoanaerobaculia bacterium]
MKTHARRPFAIYRPAAALAAALSALGAIALATLAAAPPAGERLSEVTQVTAVEVPVQVVRDGVPVRGLTANDFEVYDGRQKQTITGFEVLDLESPGAAKESLVIGPAALRRHFLVLFDLSNSEPKSLVRAQKAVREQVLKNLDPSDLVAVATYSAANGPQLALGFTSDRRQVETAVETLGLPQLVDRNQDPLKLMAATANEQFRTGGLGGGKFGDAILENLQTLARQNKQAEKELSRGAVTSYTRAMADLAKLMGSVHGRKQVVFLSEGFDSAILQGTTDVTEQANRADDVVFGNIQNIDTDQFYGNTKQNNEMERMLEEFRRADCVIQAIDIGGLRAGGEADPTTTRPSGEATLFQMARDTGGELYRNMNDLGDAMVRVLKKTNVTYVLTVQPENLKRDGAYHKLKVQLKSSPRGTRVIARPGYYAPRPYRQQQPMERAFAAANALMSGSSSGSLQTAVLAAPFRFGGDKAYVPVVIEADGATLLAGTEGTATVPAEIYVYAVDREGAIQDYFTQSLGIELAKAPPQLRQAGLKFFGHVDLPAGEYALRVLVRNGATGVYGARVERLSVPELGAGHAALLPPFFPEAPNKWLLTREAQRGAAKQVPYPFMAREQPYIPASRPDLTAGQPAAVSLVGYGLPAGDLKAEARILAADGKDLGPGELKIEGREASGAGGPDRLQATFRPPSQLQPGEYQLVVTLSAAQGGAPQQSAIRFTVHGAHS